MNPIPSKAFRERISTHLGFIFLFSLPLLFWQLGAWALFDPDEGRYAEIPREMLARHDWVTPTLNFVAYFEKPPLLYWLNAISFRLFGFSEWAARLVPAFAALLGMYLAYALGRRMWGARGGLLSALILGTSLFWTILGHELIIDTLLATILFAALTFWWLSHTQSEQQDQPLRQKYFYDAGFWVSLALAFLAKGPVAVILVGGGIFFYVLICKQWRSLAKIGWWWGVPLCALIVAPWFILVAQRNPSFNHFFWWGQNFGRFLGIGKNREHVKGVLYFFEMWPIVFFPWTFFLISAVIGWKKLFHWPPQTPRRRAVIFLLSSIIFITLFFSASTSKLITYIIPAVPFAAVLMGGYLDTLIRRKSTFSFPKISVWILAIFLISLAAGSAIFGGKALEKYEGLGTYFIIAPCLALSIWALGLIWATRCRSVLQAAFTTIACFTLFWIATLPILIAAAPNHTQKVLLQYIKPGLNDGGTIVLFHNLTQSVGYYTKRRVRIISNYGEIKHGASLLSPQQKKYWFPQNESIIKKIMQQHKPVYVMTRDHKESQAIIKKYHLNGKEIIWNKRRSIFGNAAALKITAPFGPVRKSDKE